MATDAHGDRTVLVTERFDMSLAQWVASVCSGLYVDEDVTLDVWTAMVGVCEALNAMHHMGPPMVHCDLKEENVFVHVAVRAGNSRRTMIARAAVGDFGSVVEVDVDTGVGAVGTGVGAVDTGVGAVDTGVGAGALPCDGTHEGGPGPGPVPGPVSRVQRPWEGNQFVREPGCDDTASPATDMYAFGIMFARVVCSLFVKDGCRHGRPECTHQSLLADAVQCLRHQGQKLGGSTDWKRRAIAGALEKCCIPTPTGSGLTPGHRIDAQRLLLFLVSEAECE